jgi:hypothetical protein
MVSMSDEVKERNILKLILIVRFACATLDVGYHIHLEFSHFSWNSNSESSCAFSTGRIPNREISTPDFRHNLVMLPTLCKASSIGASTFDKAASCWMMNLGQEDSQLIFSIFKLYHPSRNSLFTRRTHLRRSLMFCIRRF